MGLIKLTFVKFQGITLYEVYSFTGKSGTGKSYQAIRVAKEKGIPALIDDGLLIYKNKIVAGRSAKKM